MISSPTGEPGRVGRASDAAADNEHATPESTIPVAPSPSPRSGGALIGLPDMERPAFEEAAEPTSGSRPRPSQQANFAVVSSARQVSGAGHVADEIILERHGEALAGKFAGPTIQHHKTSLRLFADWLADHHPATGGLAGIRDADEKHVRALLSEYLKSPGLPLNVRAKITPAINALRAEMGHTAGPSLDDLDEIVLERFCDAANTRLAAGTVKPYESTLRAFGLWLTKHHPTVGGLAAIESGDALVVATLVSEYRASPNVSEHSRKRIGPAVAALRSAGIVLDCNDNAARDGGALDDLPR